MFRNDDDGLIWPTIVPEARLRHDRPMIYTRRAALCFTCGRVRPLREACLASRREKPVKWVNMIGTCSSGGDNRPSQIVVAGRRCVRPYDEN